MVNKDIEEIIDGLKAQAERLHGLVAEAESYDNGPLTLHLLEVQVTVVKARVALQSLQGMGL